MILKRSLNFEHKSRVEVVDACADLKIFLSFSLDGCIKLWSTTFQLLVDINLDVSLTYCVFAGNSGDILVGWRGHLFILMLDKGTIELDLEALVHYVCSLSIN